jgi:hypothetical protein
MSTLEPMHRSRGMRQGAETLTFVAADEKIRPTKDNMILAPEDVVHSSILYVEHKTKPLKGRVLAIGPGHYPLRYQDAHGNYIPDWDRKRRAKSVEGTRYQPTQVKVGDRVELGGAEHEGYAFFGFYWGNQYCIHCTERDVAGILDHEDGPDVACR